MDGGYIDLLDTYVKTTYGSLQRGLTELKRQRDEGRVCFDGVAHNKFEAYLQHLELVTGM